MKKILAALAAFFLLLAPASTPAMDRTQHLTGLNPPSTWMNQAQRDVRIGDGMFWWGAFGSSTTFAGTYQNLTVNPVTGLYVAVGPTPANTYGAVYQFLPEELTAYGGYPSGTGTFLAADPTQVVLQGIVPTNTANIGPLVAGSSAGQSVINLIECKVVTSDTTNQTVNIVSSGGAVTAVSANRDRVDRISCTFKSSASSTSPAIPTVDAGYVAIGYATIANGVATVTSGMITASAGGFAGFATLDSLGNLTVAAKICAVASGTCPALGAAGDVEASRSSTTGQLILGGGGSYATIDYGLSTAGALTSNAQFIAPYLRSSTAYAVGSYNQFSWPCSGGLCTMGASSGGTIAGVPSSQLLVVNGGGTGVAAMDSSGDIGASGYFSSINGLKLGNGFPPSGPDVHSDGSNLILEANTAGNSIFLRPQGLGQTTGQAQYSIANGLTIAPTINAVNTSANVAPVYTSAGANIGSTLHTVVGQAGFTLSSSCAAGAICSLASGNPIALTGAAVFNNSAYCSANANYGTNALAIQVGVSGTNSLNFQLVNPSSGALSTGPTYYVNYVCIGT